jgi:thiol-disulfide isomerase/thioredoxin
MIVRWLACLFAFILLVPACNRSTEVAKPKSPAEAAAPAPEASPAQDEHATSAGGAAAADDSETADANTPAGAEAATAADDADEAPPEPHAGEQLLAALAKDPRRRPAVSLAFEFDGKLAAGGEAAKRLADELLGVTRQAVSDQRAADYIDAVAKDAAIPAAKLLVWVVRAQEMAKSSKRPYAMGRIVIADEEYPVADVLAQVPITSEGYFATEIGDRSRPIAFRAPGYEALDVPLTSAEGDGESAEPAEADASHDQDHVEAIVLDDATMEPIASERQATFRGKLVLDDVSKSGSAKINFSMSVAAINTPSNGYSPRRSWPEPIAVDVDAHGEFEVAGLTPSNYFVSITADDHAAGNRRITLEPGETNDLGEVRLRSSDLGFYLAQDPPETPELAWEKDYEAALARAQEENRPLMVMMTATWCGPCKMLERESLSNPWIRHFLAPFVVVQAYEVQEINEKYDCGGYPTLAFCDSAGEMKHKHVGYIPTINFAAECAKAIQGVELDLPAELQELIDKEVVELD